MLFARASVLQPDDLPVQRLGSELVRLPLERGAKTTVKGGRTQYPLSTAAAIPKPSMVGILLEAGGRVVILDRPGSAGEDVSGELGERALFAPADVTSEGEVAAAVARAVERFGALHVAVNCAGVGAAMVHLLRHLQPI